LLQHQKGALTQKNKHKQIHPNRHVAKSNRNYGDQPQDNIAICPPRVLNSLAAVARRKARLHEYDGLLDKINIGTPCGGTHGACLEPQQSCIYSNVTGNSTCIGLSAFDVHVSGGGRGGAGNYAAVI
jgi:hypothetical protein